MKSIFCITVLETKSVAKINDLEYLTLHVQYNNVFFKYLKNLLLISTYIAHYIPCIEHCLYPIFCR